jgi:two-component system phosphate regulon response regulator PhoB
VDDDPDVRAYLVRVLDEEGYDVDTAPNGRAALAAVAARRPDVVLLDIMLAGESGLELLAELRRHDDVPIILVTGRGAEVDRVLGLRLGADDYVVKPFSFPELSARIASVLRRSAPRAAGPSQLAFGSLVIDPGSREVLVDGSLVPTTAKEFDLLSFLAGSPRQVFTRQQLLEHVWASSSNWQDAATVTEHIRRLRLKIEEDPDAPKRIATVRGVGYRFEP